MKSATLYMGVTDAILVSEATEIHLTVTAAKVNDSSFGDTWETKLKSPMEYSGSLSANFDTASTNLFDIAISATICKFYAYPDRASTTRYYYGTIWPDLTVDMVRTDAGRVSGSFEGSGQLAIN